MTAVLPLESIPPIIKDHKAEKLTCTSISRPRPRSSTRASPVAPTAAPLGKSMCPPTFLQQTPGVPAPSAAGTLQYSLFSLVEPLPATAPVQPAGGPAACSIVPGAQQQQQLRMQQQSGGGQAAKLGGASGREAGAAAVPQLGPAPVLDPALWLNLGTASVANHAALLGAGTQPFLGLAAPPPLQGLPPAPELHLQLESVKSQLASQQQFIRSLHKWAGSTAAAVRQVQDQWRTAKEGMKLQACESEVAGLKNQLSQLSKELEGRDIKIEGLVQELSDVKAQLVEVERMVSELGPHVKRRRLQASGSISDPTPGGTVQEPMVGAEDLLAGELQEAYGAASRVVVREGEGASFSTDRPQNNAAE